MTVLPRRRQARIVMVFGLTLAGLLVLTVPFWIWPLDLAIQNSFYDPERGGWFQKNAQPWDGFYDYGTYPALVVAIGALAVWMAGFRFERLLKWRKVSAYLMLAMILGPGLVVNAIFKDQWGRPRPRDVVEFGGKERYEQVWELDLSSDGKSFPCGHCSMAFYFLALTLLRRRMGRRVLETAVVAVLAYALGVGRIAQGGHFASDVLWAGGFCLLTSLGLYYAFGLDRSLFFEARRRQERLRIPLWVSVGGSLAGLLVILGVLLATPYEKENASVDFAVEEGFRMEIEMKLVGTDHDILLGEERPGLVSAGSGFGMAGSEVDTDFRKRISGETRVFKVDQEIEGWFTELRHENRAQVPGNVPGAVRVSVSSGHLTVDFRGISAPQSWRIAVAREAELEIIKPDDRADLLDLMVLQQR